MPRTAPRGSFHLPHGKVFTRLGRAILDKLDRGVILMDANGKVVDAGTLNDSALLYAPTGRRDISIDVLRERYGLTRAQADVARSLFAGRSVEDTARALDLSLNTVRTHLKHVFTRCAVGSQAELLHLLTNGPNRL